MLHRRGVLWAIFAGLTSAALPGRSRASLPVLARSAPLAADFDAAPRILFPATPAVESVNRAMAALDGDFYGMFNGCSAPDSGVDACRRISTPAVGADFMVVEVRDDYHFRNAAHPSSSCQALVFDLTTGAPIDWTEMLPGLVERAYPPDAEGAQQPHPAIRSPTLHAYYLKALQNTAGREDCAGVFDAPDTPFLLWPNAELGGLVMEPSDPPRVVLACAEQVVIPIAELRRMGAHPRLIKAVEKTRRR